MRQIVARLRVGCVLACLGLAMAPACAAEEFTDEEWDDINAKLVEAMAAERAVLHLDVNAMHPRLGQCHLGFSTWFRDYVDKGGGVATHVAGSIDAIYASQVTPMTYVVSIKTSVLKRSLKMVEVLPAYVGLHIGPQSFVTYRRIGDLSTGAEAVGYLDEQLEMSRALAAGGVRLSVDYGFQKTGSLRVIDFVSLVGQEAYGAELARFQACQAKLQAMVLRDQRTQP